MGGGFQQVVYYDDCRVNANECLIGEENQGWYIAATALNHERAFVEHAANGRRLLLEVIELWRAQGRHERQDHQTQLLRQKLAQIAVEVEVCRVLNYRFIWLYGAGKDPSYQASQVKVFGSEMTQRFMHVAGEVLGLYAQVQRANGDIAPLQGRIEQQIRYQPGYTLMGGTSEVQRNLIATRGLGLPR